MQDEFDVPIRIFGGYLCKLYSHMYLYVANQVTYIVTWFSLFLYNTTAQLHVWVHYAKQKLVHTLPSKPVV